MKDQRYAFLFDAPDLTAASFPDGAPEDISVDDYTPPTSDIQIAKLGSFKHPRYGDFKVTKDTFDGLIRNLATVSGGQVPMDFDHEPDYGGSTRACGWIKALQADGSKLMATVEWTWAGAWAIKEREFLYISPTWVLDYTDDAGEKKGPVLLGAALTNRPFFERMAVVTCSQTFSKDELDFAVEDAPDSRPRPMSTFATIAPLLKLSADADEAQIAAAITTLVAQSQNSVPEGHVTVAASRLADLEANQKVPQGHTVIKLDRLEALETTETEVTSLRSELADVKFEQAFSVALAEGRATPAQKDTLLAVFKADQKLGLDTIEAQLPQVVTAARGDAGHLLGSDEADQGVDQDRHDLDRKVRRYMQTHSITDYREALYAVAGEAA